MMPFSILDLQSFCGFICSHPRYLEKAKQAAGRWEILGKGPLSKSRWLMARQPGMKESVAPQSADQVLVVSEHIASAICCLQLRPCGQGMKCYCDNRMTLCLKWNLTSCLNPREYYLLPGSPPPFPHCREDLILLKYQVFYGSCP